MTDSSPTTHATDPAPTGGGAGRQRQSAIYRDGVIGRVLTPELLVRA